MNLYDVMLSEIIEHKKTKAIWLHLYEIPRVAKFIETENAMVMSCAVDKERVESLFNGYWVWIQQDEQVLWMDGGDGSTTMWMHLI
jgi:hypothetical protein